MHKKEWDEEINIFYAQVAYVFNIYIRAYFLEKYTPRRVPDNIQDIQLTLTFK